jgi:hypothetical protein
MIRVACLCPTYCRPPDQLANLIACFEWQDYENRELVILDDAGQHHQQSGDRWKLCSISRRFWTLGEKRNAVAALASPDTQIYAVFDSDDCYLPHHLSAMVKALTSSLTTSVFSIPSRLITLDESGFKLKEHNEALFHGGWGFTRNLFLEVGGYPFMQSGQDAKLLQRFRDAGAVRVDPLQFDPRPSYVYRWHDRPDSFHVSDEGGEGNGLYEQFADRPKPWIGSVTPKLERPWAFLTTALTKSPKNL